MSRSDESRGEALDRGRLEELYLRLEKPVFNVVYRWLWDRTEALDVTQESFLRLWAMRARVDTATAEPLVYRIALNLAARRRRSRRLWGWLGLEAAGESQDASERADAQLERAEDFAAVRAAVEALPEKLKRVVLLCEFSGMSHAQIAQTLGIPMGTVASRRNAAMSRLRERLESEEVAA